MNGTEIVLGVFAGYMTLYLLIVFYIDLRKKTVEVKGYELKTDDVVTINGVHEGKVTRVTKGYVRLEDVDGNQLSIKSNKVDDVKKQKDNQLIIREYVTVSFVEDHARVQDILSNACHDMNQEFEDVVHQNGNQPFVFKGVSNLNKDGQGIEYVLYGVIPFEEHVQTIHRVRQIMLSHLTKENVRLAEQTNVYRAKKHGDTQKQE